MACVCAGLALGIALLGLPWSVTGVMLAGGAQYYEAQQRQLVAAFLQAYGDTLQAGRGTGTGTTHRAMACVLHA